MNIMMLNKVKMRAAALALCTTVLYAVPSVAQDNTASQPSADQTESLRGGHSDPGKRQEHQLAMLTKKLNLTPDQVNQVKAIDDDTMKQAMAVRDDTSIAKAEKRQKMMDIHKAAQDKIRGILTDDQKTKYDAMQAQMQERMQQRRHGNDGGMGDATPPAPPQ